MRFKNIFMSIRYKIMIIFVLIVIVPVIIIAIYYDYTSYKNMKENVELLSNKIVEQTSLGINYRMKMLEKDLHMSVNNQDILDILMNMNNYDAIEVTFEKEKLNKYFDTIIYNTPYLDSIVIDLYDSETLIYGKEKQQESSRDRIDFFTGGKFYSTKEYKEITSNKNKPVWISSIYDDDNKIYLVKEFKYFMYAKKIGIITFIIDKKMITDYTNQDQENKNVYAIIDNDYRNVINGDSYNEVYKMKAYKDASNKSVKTINFDNKVISFIKLDNNWMLINEILEKDIFSTINKARVSIIIFMIIGALASIVAAWVISKNTGNKVERILSKFERLEKGDFTVDRQIKSEDEFGILESKFNNTVKELEIQIKENYLCSLEAKEAHLKALQYQINPHFLYNTLEVINSIAVTYGAEEIREITQKLGRMFRYNINRDGSDITTLGREIEHINDYIYLQQLHLSYNLMVFYDIEEELYDIKVIKFILQPIIENIIKYAFKDRESDACIEISAIVIEKDFYKNIEIIIQDDGIGMSEEVLNLVNKNLYSKKSLGNNSDEVSKGGIGLKNIQERISLSFGENYGIVINSVEGEGTKIIVTLPYIA